MQRSEYKVQYTLAARNDIVEMKRYILDNFKYHELGEKFLAKIKKGVEGIRVFPNAYAPIGIKYRGLDIKFRVYKGYIFLYVVDEVKMKVLILRIMQDDMDWRNILRYWLLHN